MQLFHYHLVSSRARELEARYLARLGFDLVARYGRVGEETTSYESGFSWERLDALGFKLRLTELERGGVNVVIQPGQWELPRVDHFGLALEEDEFVAAIARAERIGLRLQEHGGRRTFVSTRGAFRLELHPPRDWLDELLAGAGEFRVTELQLLADSPEAKAQGFAEVLDLPCEGGAVELDDLLIHFLPGGPQGRPQLEAERFE
jgi:hypothetical protein